MNTKSSVAIGWVAYTAAFAVGGGIGIYKFVYAPGGRRDREKAADLAREAEEAREAVEEERIRQERHAQSQPPQPPQPHPASERKAHAQ